MKNNVFKITAGNKFQAVIVFLRGQLGLKPTDPLVSTLCRRFNSGCGLRYIFHDPTSMGTRVKAPRCIHRRETVRGVKRSTGSGSRALFRDDGVRAGEVGRSAHEERGSRLRLLIAEIADWSTFC